MPKCKYGGVLQDPARVLCWLAMCTPQDYGASDTCQNAHPHQEQAEPVNDKGAFEVHSLRLQLQTPGGEQETCAHCQPAKTFVLLVEEEQ